jgi:hypothetical protein
VRPRFVLALLVAGGGAALLSYFAGLALMREAGLEYDALVRLVGPILEEFLKAAIVLLLIRTYRIGFVFDAAIAGFAVGTGFSIVENYFYLQVLGTDHPAIWVVRGFGTAIMHGGATAIFGMLAHLLTPQEGRARVLYVLPGFAAALALHAGFNQFLAYPVASTIVMLIGLAASLAFILKKDRTAIERWLDVDFEHQRRLLEEVRSGEFGRHDLGRILDSLHGRFHARDIAEIVRYVELHTELVLLAEDILKAREKGEAVVLPDPAKEKLRHFHEIEQEVGRAVRLALKRHLHFSRHEFFELYMLDHMKG